MKDETKFNDSVKIHRGDWFFEWRGYRINFTRRGNKKPFIFTETWYDVSGTGGKRFLEYESKCASMSKSSFESRIKHRAEQYSNDPKDTFWRRCNDSPSIIKSRMTWEERDEEIRNRFYK